jgi:hypothetical protein
VICTCSSLIVNTVFPACVMRVWIFADGDGSGEILLGLQFRTEETEDHYAWSSGGGRGMELR